jgi:hypothetical protein
MIDLYGPCACGSGKKYKFCCKQNENLFRDVPPRELVRRSREFPISECVVNEDWVERGMATIVVVRKLPNSRCVLGCYLADILCLGLKNTFCNANLPYSEIVGFKERMPLSFTAIHYEDARSVVFGAIEYAKRLGFEPNRDWADSKWILEHERPSVDKYEFGRDGHPVFIQGPDDDLEMVRAKLMKAAATQKPHG